MCLEGPDIMLPLSDMKSILRTKSDDVGLTDFDLVECDYTLFTPRIRDDHYHVNVVRGPFTRQLDQMSSTMIDEIKNSCDHLLGSDPGVQREVVLFNCLRHIVARTVSRVFVGETLCMWQRLHSYRDLLLMIHRSK